MRCFATCQFEALGLETRDHYRLLDVREECSRPFFARRYANAPLVQALHRRYGVELNITARLRAPELLGRCTHQLNGSLGWHLPVV